MAGIKANEVISTDDFLQENNGQEFFGVKTKDDGYIDQSLVKGSSIILPAEIDLVAGQPASVSQKGTIAPAFNLNPQTIDLDSTSMTTINARMAIKYDDDTVIMVDSSKHVWEAKIINGVVTHTDLGSITTSISMSQARLLRDGNSFYIVGGNGTDSFFGAVKFTWDGTTFSDEYNIENTTFMDGGRRYNGRDIKKLTNGKYIVTTDGENQMITQKVFILEDDGSSLIFNTRTNIEDGGGTMTYHYGISIIDATKFVLISNFINTSASSSTDEDVNLRYFTISGTTITYQYGTQFANIVDTQVKILGAILTINANLFLVFDRNYTFLFSKDDGTSSFTLEHSTKRDDFGFLGGQFYYSNVDILQNGNEYKFASQCNSSGYYSEIVVVVDDVNKNFTENWTTGLLGGNYCEIILTKNLYAFRDHSYNDIDTYFFLKYTHLISGFVLRDTSEGDDAVMVVQGAVDVVDHLVYNTNITTQGLDVKAGEFYYLYVITNSGVRVGLRTIAYNGDNLRVLGVGNNKIVIL